MHVLIDNDRRWKFLAGMVLSLPVFVSLSIQGHLYSIAIQLVGVFGLLVLFLNGQNGDFSLETLEHKFVLVFFFSCLVSLLGNYYLDSGIGVRQVAGLLRYLLLLLVYFLAYRYFQRNDGFAFILDGVIAGTTLGSIAVIISLFFLLSRGLLPFGSHEIHNTIFLREIFLGYPNKLGALWGTALLFVLAFRNLKVFMLCGIPLTSSLILALPKASLIGLTISLLVSALLCARNINWRGALLLGVYLVLLVSTCYKFDFFNGSLYSPTRMDIKKEVASSLFNLTAVAVDTTTKAFDTTAETRTTAAAVDTTTAASTTAIIRPLFHTAFGHGFKSPDETLPRVNYGGKSVQMGSAHDQYIEVFLKTGIVGLVSFMGFLLVTLYKHLRQAISSGNGVAYDHKAIIVIMTGFLVSNLAQENFTTDPVATLSFLLLGYLNGGIKRSSYIQEQYAKR